MAAGTGDSSGGSLESTLDRKFHSVTNTMESIQGLSAWCIDNKKYHSLIVRHWMKYLRKAVGSNRLNLFYVANDVIQNCKRKNAIVYRTAFAEVLPDAFLLVSHEGDLSVIKSVERILSIWEERSVYSRTLVADLRSSLVKEESPPETPVEQKTPVESQAELRSKIVAEFVPQALMDQLSKYKRSLEEVDLREKQLAAMRVDICSSEALKKLKDKAGGKKFSRDFEEGSAQLQEFVKFFDKQNKVGAPVLEALVNADIFYEMQYKEVKIVANAYQTFANRVSHLKRKLDALKATLPDLDESPIPSPSADAPSPTGSESPFHGMELADPHPDLDGCAMDDDAEPPAPSPLSSPGGSPPPSEPLAEDDNREVEDMELSEEEGESSGIIVDEQTKPSSTPEVSAPISAKKEPSVAATPPVAQVAPPVTAPADVPAAAALSVDVGKIGSILSSLNPVMKSTGPSVESPPAAAPAPSSKKSPVVAPVLAQDASALVNLLSKVDVSPADLLSALSKVQAHGGLAGISSLLGSSAVNVSSDSSGSGKLPPSPSSTAAASTPSQSRPAFSTAPVPSSTSKTVAPHSNTQELSQPSNPASALVQALHTDMDLVTESEPTPSSDSLESKIHSFLQENPAFSAFDIDFPSNSNVGKDHISPAAATDTRDGTPVRDEGGGTPTLDEFMDKPGVLPSSSSTKSVGETAKAASIVYQNRTPNNPPQQAHLQPGVAQNGQHYQPHLYDQQQTAEHGTAAPVAHFQQFSAPMRGPVPGERAPGSAGNRQTVEGFQRGREGSWYGDTYPEGSSQQHSVYNVTAPAGSGENKTSGMYPFQREQIPDPPEFVSQSETTTSPSFFSSKLPPVPRLPPPPPVFDLPLTSNSRGQIPSEQQQQQQPVHSSLAGEGMGGGGMEVHDHQHRSSFHPDEDKHGHPEDMSYQEEDYNYYDEHRQHDGSFFQEEPYHQRQDDSQYRPASPPHRFPRVRGRGGLLRPPSEDPLFNHNYQRQGAPRPSFAPRRPPPPPPRHDVRHPGQRPPLQRPPFPARLPQSRGPPLPQPRGPPLRQTRGPPLPQPRGSQRPLFPRFPGSDPRLRGKRPGPRGPGPMFPMKRPFLPPRF